MLVVLVALILVGTAKVEFVFAGEIVGKLIYISIYIPTVPL